ncbi:MAG: type I DNA topoisomerase [Candidatus Levybacteria bacterium]|nr:type I DNA topoisomerase [Candidatus Levybacteria bacterium]
MKLVIVESPTKARTIGKFLGKDYEIKASMGHLIDLPKSKIGIDFEHDFMPLYEIVADKKQIIADLKSSAKQADTIILATDPDREGEAIGAHVAEMLGDKKGAFKRIAFHEITKEAIEEALKNPRSIDKNLVDAQTARRVLDRLVGYKLSPLLWKKVRRGLSAGRVQSVALRLIVEREREIEKFGKEKYWTIAAILSKEKDQTEFELIEIDGNKIEIQKSHDLYDGQYKVTKTSIDLVEKAKQIVADLKTKNFVVSDVLQKATKRSPSAPYTTSTLQQDAARRLYMNGKRTMSLAQKLYEEGYITYHRTDSVTISSVAMGAIINFVKKEYGEKYVPEKPRFYKTKQKSAQEAHEAIRPTKVGVSSSQISAELGGAYGKLYDLIWKRTVASQMSDAIIESTTVIVDGALSKVIPPASAPSISEDESSAGSVRAVGSPSSFATPPNYTLDAKRYTLKANGSVLVFDGFLRVNPSGLGDNRLPKFIKDEKLDLVNALEKEHETLPPPRYNDASIIKTLEEKGIGRPSTYATIISTIESRGYIERQEGRFAPTAIGIAVNDFLVANFSDIDDIPFTASMEDELDQIANGQKQWAPMMKDFYTPFEKKLTEVEGADRVAIAVEETNEKCPQCGSPLLIRTGRFGKFLACSKFPECKFTKPFVEKTDIKCPKDGADVVVKKTRKGRKFYGCSSYPKCDFAAWKLEDIKKSPTTP